MSWLSTTSTIKHIHTEHWFEVTVFHVDRDYQLSVKANWIKDKYHIGSVRFIGLPSKLNASEQRHIKDQAERMVLEKLINKTIHL